MYNGKLTIKDIAREAGVSKQTVSRVLNNLPSVKKETRENVQRIIDKMNYYPDPLARSLVHKRTFAIGILTVSVSGTIYSRILGGTEECARKYGYSTLISGVKTGIEGEPEYSELLKQQRLDGIIINYHGSSNDQLKILAEIPYGIPIITLGYAQNDPRVKAINIDNYHGGKIAAEHLVSKGYKKIGHLTGPSHLFEVQERVRGFESLYHSSIQSLKYEGDWSFDSGKAGTLEIIEKNTDIQAIWAQCDEMAIGAMQALKETGRRIPEDVEVLGFDDLPWSRYLNPALSSIHRPTINLGKLAVLTLINEIRKKSEEPLLEFSEKPEFLFPHLVLRESCL